MVVGVGLVDRANGIGLVGGLVDLEGRFGVNGFERRFGDWEEEEEEWDSF